MIQLLVLGGFDVRADHPQGSPPGITQPKRLALLLYLALHQPAGFQHRERLLALLWPDADDASSRHSLRNALHALRQSLGDEAILTRGDSYVGLDRERFRCDALELRANLAAGRLEEALALWKGDLAPGFHVSGAPDFEHWLDDMRLELRRDARSAAWKRAGELAGSGPAELDAIRRALQLDPGNEPGARKLIRLLDAAGDRGGALRIYRDLSDYFARELDTQPSAETVALAAELRTAPAVRRASSLTPAPPALTAVTPATPEAARTEPRRHPIAVALIAAVLLTTLAFGTRAFSEYRGRSGVTPAPVLSGTTGEAARAVLRLPARYRSDTSAYSSYMRALTLRFQYRFPESRDSFAALVDRKPLYVPGIYGLAHAYIFTTLNDLTDPAETWPRIDALARRALALDSSAASAWLALAARDMYGQPNLPLAWERISRARLLDSLEPDAPAMQSVWYRFNGDMDGAVTAARLAHRLDPLSRFFDRLVGRQLYLARRYDESRAVYARLVQEDPGFRRAYIDLGGVYRVMGRPRDALEAYHRAALLAGDTARAALLQGAATDAAARERLAADARRTVADLGRAAASGRPAAASAWVHAYATLGDTVATLRWLDSIVTRRDVYLNQVRVDPVFDFLRKDPRYLAWEARCGLPPMPRSPGR